MPQSDMHRTRGYLPHYDGPSLTQHLVFRLADALAPTTIDSLTSKPRTERLDAAEAALDLGLGARSLADPRVANLVQQALMRFDTERYNLLAWCVMPTHVHVLAAQVDGWSLASVIHSWKSFTANRANLLLARKGRFWARDYFDRAMRNDRQLETAHLYIEANPVAAGLCANPEDWPWSSASVRRSSPIGP